MLHCAGTLVGELRIYHIPKLLQIGLGPLQRHSEVHLMFLSFLNVWDEYL